MKLQDLIQEITEARENPINQVKTANPGDTVIVKSCPFRVHLWACGVSATVRSVVLQPDGVYEYSCVDKYGMVQILLSSDIQAVIEEASGPI